MKELRPAIIRAHEKGKGVREIARFLDIEPSTVSRTIKRFEETGNHVRNNYQGHRRFSETPASMQMEDILNKSVLFLLLYICLLNKFS